MRNAARDLIAVPIFGKIPARRPSPGFLLSNREEPAWAISFTFSAGRVFEGLGPPSLIAGWLHDGNEAGRNVEMTWLQILLPLSSLLLFSLLAANLYLLHPIGALALPVAALLLSVPCHVIPAIHFRLFRGAATFASFLLTARPTRIDLRRGIGFILLTAGCVVLFDLLPHLEVKLGWATTFSWVGELPGLLRLGLGPAEPPRMGPVIGILVFALLPAIYEETLYRGYLRSCLVRIMPRVVAHLLVAFLFAVAHGRPTQVMTLTLFGLVLGVMTEFFRSIWPAVVAHTANNALLYLAGITGFQLPCKRGWLMLAVLAIGVGIAWIRRPDGEE